MRLEFEIPCVPNFIRTKQGDFPLRDLSENELLLYSELWYKRLIERRKEQITFKKLRDEK